MIERTCELGREDCRGPYTFTVRYASNPKRFCGVDCKRVADRSGERSRGRVLRFIDGMTPLEVFEVGVRMGYDRRVKEQEDEPLGEIGRLTDGAMSC